MCFARDCQWTTTSGFLFKSDLRIVRFRLGKREQKPNTTSRKPQNQTVIFQQNQLYNQKLLLEGKDQRCAVSDNLLIIWFQSYELTESWNWLSNRQVDKEHNEMTLVRARNGGGNFRQSVIMPSKGLLNNPGENNCFMNSAVQVRIKIKKMDSNISGILFSRP